MSEQPKESTVHFEGTAYSNELHVLRPGQGFGFNPLMLGDRLEGGEPLNRTYEVVRKLGHGGNGSVWLVRFSDNPTAENHFLALKVLTVNLTAAIVDYKYWELDSGHLVAETNPEHPGYQHCVMLREYFVCNSYHGPHFALAFDDILGSDIQSLQRTQPNKAFPTYVTKRIIKQVLLALDYLHRECFLVHTDVKPQNIMVSLNASDTTIADYLHKNPATIYEMKIEPPLSPEPIITVMSQPLPNFGLNPSLDNLVVKLADYGEALPLEEIEVETLCRPTLLRAPEVILGRVWSTPIDIWSVGCLVFEHLAGTPLFQLYENPDVSFTDSHLQQMSEHLGSFPPDFLAKCNKRAEYFDENGGLVRVKMWSPQTIEQRLANYKYVRYEDIVPAAAFIRGCLTLDPSVRPRASELLQDDWLSGV